MKCGFQGAAKLFMALALVFVFFGCGALMRSATRPVMDNLSKSVMKQRDLELVRLGAPAYLIMIDGFLEGSPESVYLLSSAAKLYGAYGSAFALGRDEEQARLMTAKAKEYAFKAASLENDAFARLHSAPPVEFEAVLPTFEKGDEALLLLVINSWAGYIRARPGKWEDIADLPKIEALTKRLLELDETHYYGAAHLVMGTIRTLLPPSLGGKPEEAREHFQRAMEISGGDFLQTQVAYASRYARGVYDRELHDRLLEQVMDTPVDKIPELTLLNALAKREAARLLESADEYF